MHRSSAPLDTPIGRLWVTVSPAGLIEVARSEAPPIGATVDPAATATVIGELEAYFAGVARSFTVPLDLAGVTPFDAEVWSAARSIPYGATVSYGELAMMAGHPNAARAVGGSMARCPFLPVVPCHRVIHADGSIGGWGSDPWIKRWLLDLERGSGRGPEGGEHTVFTPGDCNSPSPAAKRPDSRGVTPSGRNDRSGRRTARNAQSV